MIFFYVYSFIFNEFKLTYYLSSFLNRQSKFDRDGFLQKDVGRLGLGRVISGICQLSVGADAGVDQSTDHQHRQDGRMPDLPQCWFTRRLHCYGQIFGDERSRTQSRRRLCK